MLRAGDADDCMKPLEYSLQAVYIQTPLSIADRPKLGTPNHFLAQYTATLVVVDPSFLAETER